MLDRAIDQLVAQRILLEEDKALLALPVAVKPRPSEELRRYVLGAEAPLEREAALAAASG